MKRILHFFYLLPEYFLLGLCIHKLNFDETTYEKLCIRSLLCTRVLEREIPQMHLKPCVLHTAAIVVRKN